MSTWALVPNFAWQGRKPVALISTCHDGSPFLTVKCSCGAEMHMHETQVVDYADAMIGSSCMGCGELLTFPPGTFARAFAQMRSEGWLE